MKQNCCAFLLNSVRVLLSQHTTSKRFSDSVLCDDKQVQNVKKPQFERVARAQYPNQIKKKLHGARAATVHVCEMSLHLWPYKETFGYS